MISKLEHKIFARKSGFTIIEILIVLGVVALLATLTTAFLRTDRTPTISQFVRSLNQLTAYAVQEAQVQKKYLRLTLHNKRPRSFFIEEAVTTEANTAPTYQKIVSHQISTSLAIPDDIAIVTVYDRAVEVLAAQKDRAWITINSRGVLSPCSIHVTNRTTQKNYTLRTEPFFGTIKLLDGHSKPAGKKK